VPVDRSIIRPVSVDPGSLLRPAARGCDRSRSPSAGQSKTVIAAGIQCCGL